MNGSLTANSILYGAGTNLATKIASLTPIDSVISVVKVGSLQTTLGLTVNENAVVYGDVQYGLMGKSVASQFSTLNGLRTNGTLSSTTTFQTIFAVGSQRGFIYVAAGPPCYSTAAAFFEGFAGYSYGSLTLIAQSGNAASAPINTSSAATGGIVNVSLQLVAAGIQVKTSTSCPVSWFVTYF